MIPSTATITAMTPISVLLPYLLDKKSATDVNLWCLLINTILRNMMIQIGAKSVGPKYMGKKPGPPSAALPTLPKKVQAVQ